MQIFLPISENSLLEHNTISGTFELPSYVLKISAPSLLTVLYCIPNEIIVESYLEPVSGYAHISFDNVIGLDVSLNSKGDVPEKALVGNSGENVFSPEFALK